MRVLVSGAGGLIGSALTAALAAAGHRVSILVRRPSRGPDEIAWAPGGGHLDPRAIEGFEAVVHLSGATIGVRWTEARRRAIVASRVDTTRLLAETLAGLDRPPAVLVSMSAIGIYGDRGEEVLDEGAEPGRGFLPGLGTAWEGAADAAGARGIRVAHPRTGLVLTYQGGVLERLLPIFRLGLGGPIADGRAWWSWIALDDLVAAIVFTIERDMVRGPFNAVAPGAVRNRTFSRALARALDRPALFPVPAFALRLVYGEMADATILASAHVVPARLGEAGFTFRFPELDGALAHALGRR